MIPITRRLRPFLISRRGRVWQRRVSRSDDFRINIAVGGGLEYWFNRSFSVNDRALLGVPLTCQSSHETALSTFEPGVGATFYFQ